MAFLIHNIGAGIARALVGSLFFLSSMKSLFELGGGALNFAREVIV